MSEHTAKIVWNMTGSDFVNGQYSREHTWEFDGGVTVPASASPSAVVPPFSNPEYVDPEEAFVASISSCHMLTFLFLAAKAGFQVQSYEDDAVGVMTKNESGVIWVSAVTLSPHITFGGAEPPGAEQLRQLHHDAHHQCLIANSVKTAITISNIL